MRYVTLAEYLNYIDWNDYSFTEYNKFSYASNPYNALLNKFGYASKYMSYTALVKKPLIQSDYIKTTTLIVSLLNRYKMRCPGNL